MNTTKENERVKSALSKLNSPVVVRLLKPLNDPVAAKGFVEDIETYLARDVECYSLSASVEKQSFKEQYETLVGILKQTDSLLKLMLGMGFDKRASMDDNNAHIFALIRFALHHIKKKKDPECFPSYTISPTYPAELIDSLQEMRDAVALAAEGVKPKRGNSMRRDPDTIRKKMFAHVLVASYDKWFKKIPPINEDGIAHLILVRLLAAANVPGDSFLHPLREAIEIYRGAPKKISHEI